MRRVIAIMTALALAGTLLLALPKDSLAGGRAAEGALIATGVILFGQALGIFPVPRPFFHPHREVVIIREPPVVIYDPPPFERYWVPGHWEDGIWVSGHWEYRPIYRGYRYEPPVYGPYRSEYRGW